MDKENDPLSSSTWLRGDWNGIQCHGDRDVMSHCAEGLKIKQNVVQMWQQRQTQHKNPRTQNMKQRRRRQQQQQQQQK